jgi:hypothetical protein
VPPLPRGSKAPGEEEGSMRKYKQLAAYALLEAEALKHLGTLKDAALEHLSTHRTATLAELRSEFLQKGGDPHVDAHYFARLIAELYRADRYGQPPVLWRGNPSNLRKVAVYATADPDLLWLPGEGRYRVTSRSARGSR